MNELNHADLNMLLSDEYKTPRRRVSMWFQLTFKSFHILKFLFADVAVSGNGSEGEHKASRPCCTQQAFVGSKQMLLGRRISSLCPGVSIRSEREIRWSCCFYILPEYNRNHKKQLMVTILHATEATGFFTVESFINHSITEYTYED
jgi:hypothetical protein